MKNTTGKDLADWAATSFRAWLATDQPQDLGDVVPIAVKLAMGSVARDRAAAADVARHADARAREFVARGVPANSETVRNLRLLAGAFRAWSNYREDPVLAAIRGQHVRDERTKRKAQR